VECVVCHRTEPEVRLHKCPICFRHCCDDCAHRAYGRTFCSRSCAEQFFFGDEDE
jgi:hypothetical protein